MRVFVFLLLLLLLLLLYRQLFVEFLIEEAAAAW
jgi:hypothetical protein